METRSKYYERLKKRRRLEAEKKDEENKNNADIVMEDIKFELIKELKILPEVLNLIIINLITQSQIHLFASTSKENKRIINELNNNHLYWKLLILRDFYDLPWCIKNLESPIPSFMLNNPYIREDNENIRKLIIYKNCYLWYRIFFNYIKKIVELKTYFMPDDKFNRLNEENYLDYPYTSGELITYDFRNIVYRAYSNEETDTLSYLGQESDIFNNNIRNIIHLNNNQHKLKYSKLAPLYFFHDTIYESMDEPVEFRDEKEIPQLLICIKTHIRQRPSLQNFSLLDYHFQDDDEDDDEDDIEITKIPFFIDGKKKYYFDINSNDKGELLKKVKDKLMTKNLNDFRIDVVATKINQFKLLEELYGEKVRLNTLKTQLPESQNTILEDFEMNELDSYSCFYPLKYSLKVDSCYLTNNKLNLSKSKKEIKTITFITTTSVLQEYLSNKENNSLVNDNNPILQKYILNFFKKESAIFDHVLRQVIIKKTRHMNEEFQDTEVAFFTFLEHSIWAFVEDILLLFLNNKIGSQFYDEDDRIERALYQTIWEMNPNEDRNYTKGFSFFLLLFSFYLSKELNMFNLYKIEEKDTEFIKTILNDILLAYALPKENNYMENIIKCLSYIMSKEPKITKKNEKEEKETKTFFGNLFI